MEIFGYRKLIAYQKAKEVVKRTYKLLKKFPAEERYAMCEEDAKLLSGLLNSYKPSDPKS